MLYNEDKYRSIVVAIMLKRAKKGLTLTELSKLCGLSVVTLSKIERFKVKATLRSLQKITKALEINLEELL